MPDKTTPVVEAEPVVEQTPETPINAPTPEEIAAGADKPDAMSNAIKAEREKAKIEREARIAAEARIKEFEDAQKSDEVRREAALKASQTEAETLRSQIKTLEVKQLRSDVAAAKKLPPKLASRLTGETVEEIEADADALLEDLGTLPGETPPPGDGGVRTPVPPKDLDDQIREAEKAGDFRKSMSLKTQKLLASKQA